MGSIIDSKANILAGNKNILSKGLFTTFSMTKIPEKLPLGMSIFNDFWNIFQFFKGFF